ncbi:MAG: hypothetical protein ABR905_14260 [Terracidiphilus sp.]|jgi:hypothetical protein
MNKVAIDSEIYMTVKLLVSMFERGDNATKYELWHEYLCRRTAWKTMTNDPDEIDKRITNAFIRVGWQWWENLDMADFTFVPLVRIHQHPVGHGGFHTGALGNGRAQIRWIYDCGSWTSVGKRALKREINQYSQVRGRNREEDALENIKKIRVDLFFVSHFDSDHVSGISELLDGVTIDTVVIPYIDPIDRAAIFAATAVDKGVSEQFASFMSDIPAWFSERNVRRIILVGQGGPDTTARLAQREPPPGGNVQNQRTSGLTFINETGRQANLGETGLVSIAPGAGWIVELIPGAATDWTLLPFVSKASDDARRRIETELTELLGISPTDKGFPEILLKKLTDGAFRKRLKVAYKRSGLGDANTVSMSLYAGPYRKCTLTSRKLIFTDKWSERRPSGWLLTGDSELDNAARRRDWLHFFQPFNEFRARA